MQTINLYHINYEGILSLLTPNQEKRLPSIKEMHTPQRQKQIIAQWSEGNEELLVFTNGLMLFRQGENETVQDIRNCSMTYEFCDGSHYKVEQEVINKLPALLMLLKEGRERIEHNADNRECYHHEFSAENDGSDWEEKLSVPSFVEKAEQEAAELEEEMLLENRKIILRKVLGQLPDKQQEIIRLYYYENLTQQEIADRYGITRRSVQERLEWAMKKLRKNFALEGGMVRESNKN